MINKGIIFVGDSFTWGHGLWQYYPYHEYVHSDDITGTFSNSTPLKLYHKSVRWPRLVANHFQTFEMTRRYTAGSDYESLSTISQFFKDDELCEYQGNYHEHEYTFSYDDISYVIFGTSYIVRCPFVYNVDEASGNKIYFLNDITPEKMLSFGFDNIVDLLEYHKRYYYFKIKNKLQELEKRGVKTLIWSVNDDYKELMQDDQWMQDRLIRFRFGDVVYDNIEPLMKDKTMRIDTDEYFEKFQNRKPPADGHPSLHAQKVIAQNVIEAMELRNFQGW